MIPKSSFSQGDRGCLPVEAFVNNIRNDVRILHMRNFSSPLVEDQHCKSPGLGRLRHVPILMCLQITLIESDIGGDPFAEDRFHFTSRTQEKTQRLDSMLLQTSMADQYHLKV